MNLIESYFNSKSKTHWRIWPNTNSSETFQNTFSWVLYMKEDAGYIYGIEDNEEECIREIKEAIGTYLKGIDLL